jgi:hypothetical protein
VIAIILKSHFIFLLGSVITQYTTAQPNREETAAIVSLSFRLRMLGTGKKKGESWNRREGQTEEENRPWWMAKLSSKGKGIQVSKVGHSSTGSAGNMLVIHNRTLRMNSRSVDEREIREREKPIGLQNQCRKTWVSFICSRLH